MLDFTTQNQPGTFEGSADEVGRMQQDIERAQHEKSHAANLQAAETLLAASAAQLHSAQALATGEQARLAFGNGGRADGTDLKSGLR